MKKLILFFAATMLLAVSCSKTLEVVPTSDNGTAIGFGTWTDVLTKRTQGGNAFVNTDNMAVYGYKDKATPAPVTVFNGTTVTYDGSVWTYSPVQFWDHTYDTYTFFAVSPAGIVASATPQTGVFTSNSLTFAGNDNDVLVADKVTVAESSYGAAVNMTFNHVAALLDLKVRKSDALSGSTVAITSISLTNVDATGTFTVADYSANAPHPTVNWTPTARTSYSNTSGVTSVASLPTNVVSRGASASTNGDLLINNLVVMPQSFRTAPAENVQTVNIQYTITTSGVVNTYDKSFELKAFDTDDDTDNEDAAVASWQQGKHYTFYITINADAITFTASITDWTTDAGYYWIVR